MSTPSHNHDVKWAQVVVEPVDDLFDVTADAEGVTVTGICPRCAGHTSSTLPLGIAGAKGLFSRSKDKVPSPAEQAALKASETFLCECGFAHPGQPENTLFEGCGAQWKFRAGAGTGGTS
ncbi:hypothetical protein [Streptomyces turgidiscabies]|uniref:Uncharacterized protein n=1 Tax=Streptomyces turgidiscabies TaxID=85558 RepID=A0ABU0RY50_9ACTN|nr:hypothetical protein [Streptomyces turgidiscabies]MDQ0936886.1 hypothetical protein [Streptomyces turgidiscabies]